MWFLLGVSQFKEYISHRLTQTNTDLSEICFPYHCVDIIAERLARLKVIIASRMDIHKRIDENERG